MNDLPPQEFWQGVIEFNEGNFYACHDILEAVWLDAPESQKKFYQGILQVAVACYHLSNKNWQGAVILLGEGVKRLSSYEAIECGIDLENFIFESLELLTNLQNISPDEVVNIASYLGLISEENIVNSELKFSAKLPYIKKL